MKGATVSVRLRAYLALERAMFDLDQEGDELADSIRDNMDPIWHALTPADRKQLDSREGDLADFVGTVNDDPSCEPAGGAPISREVRRIIFAEGFWPAAGEVTA